LVHPGADLTRVQIAYRGIDGLKAAEDGSLEINTSFWKACERRHHPYLSGDRRSARQRLTAVSKLLGEASYSFEVAEHKAEYAIIVDPTLLYSTFLGGSAGNNRYDRARDISVIPSGTIQLCVS